MTGSTPDPMPDPTPDPMPATVPATGTDKRKKPFPLRLDPALHAAIARAAASELRSINAEIDILLREALVRRGITVAVTTPPKRGRPPVGG